MSLKLYIDYISQPSRAVLIFCKLTGIPFEIVETRINKLDHQKKQYEININPVKKVPAIMDGDFSLFESHAILRYLARSRDVPDHYYPKDPKGAAEVDKILDWHHSNLRAGAAGLVFNLAFAPKLGVEVKVDIEGLKKILKKSLETIEEVFLGEKRYLNGDLISIADLSAACEIYQLVVLKFDFSPYPKIRAWLKRMLEIKEFEDGHSPFMEVVKKVFNPDPKL